ncbi:zinc finger BED domain-containing protein 5 [Trichonephila clavata]|uniref:Zinc finger BED domain-containing protein 5 n=1 Tax=Trichonephila clavata TaxID=2740835 RepID=A0A8X6KJM7_TRICU|nr:zinc finger BED domain-containing protein 5 [Trichonephila clavata]
MAWLSTPAYLVDLFEKLNKLCLAQQGKQVNKLKTKEEFVTFSRRIQYWISAVQQNNCDCSQRLSDFLEEFEVDLGMEIRYGIKTHLSGLQQSLSDYFPIPENQDDYWAKNPLTIDEK